MHPQILFHHLKLISHYQLWPHRFNWAQRLILICLFSVAFFALAARFYPASRLALRSEIGGIGVGGQSSFQAAQTLKAEDLATKEVKLNFNNRIEITTSYQEMGFEFDISDSVTQALKTQNEQKRTPTNWSLLFKKHQLPLRYTVNANTFDKFLRSDLSRYTTGPHNASLQIDEGQTIISPSMPLLHLEKERLMAEVAYAAKNFETQINLTVVATEPRINTADASSALIQVQNLLSRKPILQFEDKVFIVHPDILQSWIVISEERDINSLRVDIDQIKITKYVKSVSREINIPVKHTYRMLRDGRVIQVTEGKKGRKVDVKKTTKSIISALKTGNDLIPITATELKPRVIDTTGYSPTNAGLSLLLKDFVNSHSGVFGIQAYSLDRGIIAGYQVDQKFVTASTYKMFLAYAVLSEIEASRLSLASPTNIGWSVDACIREMILHSTNFCAIALGQKIGWARAEKIIHEAGFTDTIINNYNSSGYAVGDKYSTAADEADFLNKLNGQQLLNSKHTEMLLGLMKRQIYRDGIPSGVPYGTVVANKIGFLDGYLHDVAIVYSPKETYILAIMTKWGGWWQFAELSAKVYELFNQQI